MGGKGKHRSTTNRRPKRNNKPSKYAGKALNARVKVNLSGINDKITDSLVPSIELSNLTRREIVKLERVAEEKDNNKAICPILLKNKTKDINVIVTKFNKREKGKKRINEKINENFDLWESKKAVKVVEKEGKVKKYSIQNTVKASGSFNPSVKDHLAGLSKAVSEERTRLQRIKDNNSMRNVLRNRPQTIQKLTNVSATFYESSDAESPLGITDNSPMVAVGTKVTRRKKSKRTRRNEQQQRLVQAQAKARKQSRIFSNDLNNLRSIKRKLVVKEKEDLKKSSLEKPVKSNEVKELVNVVLPSDLTSQKLSKIKPHGNILADRFKVMKSKNLFEIGKKTHKRK